MTEKQFNQLRKFSFLWPDFVKISKGLQRIGVKECNYGLTKRDDTRRAVLQAIEAGEMLS